MKSKIGICIPFYLRGKSDNEAYRITFAHYAKLGYIVHLCGSECQLSQKFAEPLLSDTVKYFEVPQQAFCWLSGGDDNIRKKFNDSIKTLPKDCDWFCLAGADDIATKGFFIGLEYADPSGIKMAGVSTKLGNLFIHDLAGKDFRCVLRYHVELLPGINAFTREALEINNFRPYNLQGCETGAERYYKSRGEIVPIEACHIIMVKERECLNNVEKIKRVHKCYPLTDNEQYFVNLHL